MLSVDATIPTTFPLSSNTGPPLDPFAKSAVIVITRVFLFPSSEKIE